MITPDEFLKIVRNDKKQKVVKFAEIADSEGRLIFDGEITPTIKEYPSLSSYSPSKSDRVMVFQGVIIGALGEGGTSGTGGNLDGGKPNTEYGGMEVINGGGIIDGG